MFKPQETANSITDHKRRDMLLLSSYLDELCVHPKLRYLFWQATNRCNLRCQHCGSNCKDTGFNNELTASEMTGFWRQLSEDFSPSETYLCITGGEPLLRPDLFSIMEVAASSGFFWGMTTNGTLLTNKLIKEMYRTNCTTVSVSIDGLRDSHNTLRRSNCFDDAVRGTALLIESGYFNHIQVTTVIHKGNIGQLHELHELVKRIGADSWRLLNVEPIGRAHAMKQEHLEVDDFIRLLKFIREQRKSHSKPEVLFGCSHFVTLEYEKDVRDNFFTCGSGIMIASILANGDICGCLNIEEKYNMKQGSIRSERFSEVWKEKFTLLRKRRDQESAFCSGCSDADICRGDSAHTYDFENRSPLLCLKKMGLV